MGWTVLYIAFGLVALWLLGEVLLQYKARLRWRLLAFTGFLIVVFGVLLPSVPVIVLGAVAFAVGQTYVTLSFRKGFSTGWALGGRPGASRRRKAPQRAGAATQEPTLQVSDLDYEPEPEAAPQPPPVYAPEVMPDDTGQYGVYSDDHPAPSAAPGYDGYPGAPDMPPGADAFPPAEPYPGGYPDAYPAAAPVGDPAYAAAAGYGNYGYDTGQNHEQQAYGYDTGQQQYAAYADTYPAQGGYDPQQQPYGDGQQPYGDGQQPYQGGPYTAQQPYAAPADPYAAQDPAYGADTPPGGVWVPQQRDLPNGQFQPEQPYPYQDPGPAPYGDGYARDQGQQGYEGHPYGY